MWNESSNRKHIRRDRERAGCPDRKEHAHDDDLTERSAEAPEPFYLSFPLLVRGDAVQSSEKGQRSRKDGRRHVVTATCCLHPVSLSLPAPDVSVRHERPSIRLGDGFDDESMLACILHAALPLLSLRPSCTLPTHAQCMCNALHSK